MVSRRRPLPAATRRALRLAALDGWPPDPPADREAASAYHYAYQLGLEQWQRQHAKGAR